MKDKELNNEQFTPQDLAKHLRQPSGEAGKKVGDMMNKGNKHICLNSYKTLAPKPGDHVLEIGMGNGTFVTEFIEQNSITYVGLDYSPTMVQEAELKNTDVISKSKACFVEASVEHIPNEDDTFDAITTTNTIYFWPNPSENASELKRVLKPGGKILIAYRDKSFMDNLEITRYGFEKYHSKDIEILLTKAGFSSIQTIEIKEPEMEFDGKKVAMSGFYTTAIKV